VEAFLTRQGGHLAPVTFQTRRGPIQPFAVAPWAQERFQPPVPPLLRALRGDFFCLPFGGNGTPWKKEHHPPHGQTASGTWSYQSLKTTAAEVTLTVEMRLSIRRGRVIKSIRLRAGEANIYCRHELRGFSGPMSLGHHAMLQFPHEEGSGQIALSPWRDGRVCPQPFESAEQGGYSALKPGAPFRDLRHVPLAAGGTTDLTRYPARAGFEDLVMVSARPTRGLAWSTVSFPKQGYLWFALKDPRVLASTVLWHSNGGRHYPPWNGRHRGVLGVEEVTSYFHFGQAESAASNPLSRRGIPTVIELRPTQPFVVNYIMGVAALPRAFDRVAAVKFSNHAIRFESAAGPSLEHEVDLGFFAPSGHLGPHPSHSKAKIH
jgi:hypothetical protein